MASETEMLIRPAREGSREALEKLLRSHEGMVAAYVSGRLPTRLQGLVSVEDVVQQVLLEAYLKIDRLRGDSPLSFQAWLKAIAHTVLMGLSKDQGRKKRGGAFHRIAALVDASNDEVDVLEVLPGNSLTASRRASRREAIRAIQAAVASLPGEQKAAVQLNLLQGKSIDETSEILDKSPAAVRGLIHRGKQRIGEAMGRASAWLSTR